MSRFLRVAPSGYVLGRAQAITSYTLPPPPQVYVTQPALLQSTGGGSEGGGGGSPQVIVADVPAPGYGSEPGTAWYPPPGVIGYY